MDASEVVVPGKRVFESPLKIEQSSTIRLLKIYTPYDEGKSQIGRRDILTPPRVRQDSTCWVGYRPLRIDIPETPVSRTHCSRISRGEKPDRAAKTRLVG